MGSDADIVLLDPSAETVISAKTHKSDVDYSIFEGFAIPGAVNTVLLRGKVVARNHEYIGSLTDGQFIARQPYGLGYNVTVDPSAVEA